MFLEFKPPFVELPIIIKTSLILCVRKVDYLPKDQPLEFSFNLVIHFSQNIYPTGPDSITLKFEDERKRDRMYNELDQKLEAVTVPGSF